ncbi:MAG: DUF3990 domain-containing protein [Tannerella sp.]|jgi:hypothetical protein|nr:DUF3990 domain-containing protein [Tannerella sp.]
MQVYHGSYRDIIEIDLSQGWDNRDFGKGFYVTNIRSQAEYWATRIGMIRVSPFKPFPNAFAPNAGAA